MSTYEHMEGRALCLNKPFALLFQFYVKTYQHNDPSVGILLLDMESSLPGGKIKMRVIKHHLFKSYFLNFRKLGYFSFFPVFLFGFFVGLCFSVQIVSSVFIIVVEKGVEVVSHLISSC